MSPFHQRSPHGAQNSSSFIQNFCLIALALEAPILPHASIATPNRTRGNKERLASRERPRPASPERAAQKFPSQPVFIFKSWYYREQKEKKKKKIITLKKKSNKLCAAKKNETNSHRKIMKSRRVKMQVSLADLQQVASPLSPPGESSPDYFPC